MLFDSLPPGTKKKIIRRKKKCAEPLSYHSLHWNAPLPDVSDQLRKFLPSLLALTFHQTS